MVDMNREEIRLGTFHSWPRNAPVDAERLAKAGFFATGNYMEAQCNWCNKKISDWQYGDQAMGRHRRIDPLCPFVINPTNCGNVPITSSSNTTDSTNQDIVPEGDLKNERCRLATFKDWPNPNISPQSLAKAGFYYLNISDRVRCAWCQGVIAEWERNDDAFVEHQRFFPNCPRVQLGPLIEIASDGIRDLGIQQICPPQRPKFASLDARLRTFANWPISDIQKPEILAQAGFYYQDFHDQVRCFHCNGGLRSWQKEDDPWFEHGKWFPHCQFLKLVKGPMYSVQVRNQVLEMSHQAATVENRGPSNENAEQVFTLDEAMMTEPVRRALEMGLNEGRIRNATRQYLEYYGKPYQTTEELVEAVLEGQAEEEEDDSAEQSSSIVREVSRILNNIFNPRNPNEDGDFEENATDDEEAPAAAVISRRPPSAPCQQLPTPPPTPTSTPSTVSNTNSTKKTTQMTTETSSPLKMVPDLNKQLSLEEENRKLKDARLCKVCMDEEVGVVFLPCGHLVTCVQCAPSVNMCPLCRSSIKGFVRTFLS